jgi:hypothetical protein
MQALKMLKKNHLLRYTIVRFNEVLAPWRENMKVKIDEKLICIPPYVSTTWDQVAFLQSEEDSETHLFTLMIHLLDGKTVAIPNLDASLIDIAFSAHIHYLERALPSPSKPKGEQESKTIGHLFSQLTGLSPEQLTNMPIRLGISGIEGMPGMEVLQHNPSQSHSSDMPSEVLEKISIMIKTMTNGDVSAFPKPEPHCNCPHCQVARSIHNLKTEEALSDIDQPVEDEDLTFKNWEIVKKGENLYVVTNPLDLREQYNVYLGSPVGCTCGQSHCEHIEAVLYS